MSIILSNETDNEDMGYIVYDSEADQHLPVVSRRVIVEFWTTDSATRKVIYPSKQYLYADMKMFVGSPLEDFTKLHKAKAFMGKDFIQYYEETNNIAVVGK